MRSTDLELIESIEKYRSENGNTRNIIVDGIREFRGEKADFDERNVLYEILQRFKWRGLIVELESDIFFSFKLQEKYDQMLKSLDLEKWQDLKGEFELEIGILGYEKHTSKTSRCHPILSRLFNPVEGRVTLMDADLDSMPIIIGKLNNLEELVFSFNRLEIIPERLMINNIHLKDLVLEKNQISQIPGQISNLKDLKVLNLDSNNLTSIPAHISGLKRLSSLSLPGNQIKHISDEICELSELVSDKCIYNSCNVIYYYIYDIRGYLRFKKIKIRSVVNSKQDKKKIISQYSKIK